MELNCTRALSEKAWKADAPGMVRVYSRTVPAAMTPSSIHGLRRVAAPLSGTVEAVTTGSSVTIEVAVAVTIGSEEVVLVKLPVGKILVVL